MDKEGQFITHFKMEVIIAYEGQTEIASCKRAKEILVLALAEFWFLTLNGTLPKWTIFTQKSQPALNSHKIGRVALFWKSDTHAHLEVFCVIPHRRVTATTVAFILKNRGQFSTSNYICFPFGRLDLLPVFVVCDRSSLAILGSRQGNPLGLP